MLLRDPGSQDEPQLRPELKVCFVRSSKTGKGSWNPDLAGGQEGRRDHRQLRLRVGGRAPLVPGAVQPESDQDLSEGQGLRLRE